MRVRLEGRYVRENEVGGRVRVRCKGEGGANGIEERGRYVGRGAVCILLMVFHMYMCTYVRQSQAWCGESVGT